LGGENIGGTPSFSLEAVFEMWLDVVGEDRAVSSGNVDRVAFAASIRGLSATNESSLPRLAGLGDVAPRDRLILCLKYTSSLLSHSFSVLVAFSDEIKWSTTAEIGDGLLGELMRDTRFCLFRADCWDCNLGGGFLETTAGTLCTVFGTSFLLRLLLLFLLLLPHGFIQPRPIGPLRLAVMIAGGSPAKQACPSFSIRIRFAAREPPSASDSGSSKRISSEVAERGSKVNGEVCRRKTIVSVVSIPQRAVKNRSTDRRRERWNHRGRLC
jgi:hypothetical protein